MRSLRFTPLAVAVLLCSLPLFAGETPSSIPDAVDQFIDRALQEQDLNPAPPADDATLLRRLTLDLAGRIPTAGELQAYLAAKEPARRVKLVDRLLESGAFVRHQVNEFDALLAAPGM